MYYQDSGQRSHKSQSKRADRMILPSSSQKHSRMYLRLCGSQETNRWKVRLHHLLSPFFFHHSSPGLFANWQEQWVWLAVVQTCILNTCISHTSPSACTGCIRGAYGNPCQSIIWWLMIITARRSFYQTSWTCSCLDLPIMEAWLSIHDHINVCNSWHNIINGNRMKQQILLLRGVDSWSRSIVTAIMETQLSFLRMVIE